MDVSFILSADELFTLISLIPGHTDAGRRFCGEELAGAEICGLDSLIEKKLAKHGADGRVELSPVIGMLTDALARADSMERLTNGWIARSPWVTLRCDAYPYMDKHYRITPLKEG